MLAHNPFKSTARRWLHVILWGIALWAVLYLGVLFYAAPQVRQLTPQSGTTVSLGPLSLVHIRKIVNAREASYTLAFTVQSGTAALGCICFTVEALILIGLPAAYQWNYRRRLMHNAKK
jgi:hypothetical protein